MPTYYKYAERDADSYINWAEIGKNMSDMLTNENKVREEKKAAIDQSSREFGEILANAPQGESKLMNEWALKYGGDAQSARLMQDKLLKSGQLKLNDYLVMRQNVTDGTTSAFALSKEYQEEFKTKWDRMKEDQSQDLEQFLMGEAEGFGNFNQTQLYINPTDGKVSVAYKEKGEDGVYRMTANPNKFTDINSLRNRIKGQFDKYDVNTNMESFVAGLGLEINSFVEAKNGLYATGTIREALDITQRKNLPKDMQSVVIKFEEAETKALSVQLANPYNTSSILTNAVDICPTNKKPYTYTWSADDAKSNPEKILLTNKSNGNPVPNFSEEQESVALEHLRLQARLKYDKKSTLTGTPQINRNDKPQYVAEGDAANKVKLDAAGAWNQLYTGKTAAEKQAAADILLGTPQAIANQLLKIDATQQGKVTLQYANPKNNRTIDMLDENGDPISLNDFSSKGVELHGVTDRKKAMAAGGGGKGYGKISDWSTVHSERAGAAEEPDYTANVATYAKANTEKSIMPDKAGDTVSNLTYLYSDYGFSFEADEATLGTTDNIKIKAQNGKVSPWISVDNKNNVEVINAFIRANYDKEAVKKMFTAPR
jgi:hypothetical protein